MDREIEDSAAEGVEEINKRRLEAMLEKSEMGAALVGRRVEKEEVVKVEARTE